MSKPTEERYPSGPIQVGEQKPGGRSNTPAYYKAITIPRADGMQAPRKVIRQEQQKPANDVTKTPSREDKNDGCGSLWRAAPGDGRWRVCTSANAKRR